MWMSAGGYTSKEKIPLISEKETSSQSVRQTSRLEAGSSYMVDRTQIDT
jgi:hypothetical protein